VRIQILIAFAAIFVLGLSGGFYIALYTQSQIALLAGIAVLFAFLTWLGSGTDIITLLRDWYKEGQQKVIFSMEYDPQANPHLYSPMLELITMTGERTNISRRYLKIGIKNSGGIVAKQCKVTLRVVRSDEGTRAPSQEPKVLLWENGQIYQDIGMNRTEYVHVVLSDSRLESHLEENILALVSTPDTVNMIPANQIRAQDGFGVGASDFDLMATSESGETLTAKLKVHVTNKWQELIMEKIG